MEMRRKKGKKKNLKVNFDDFKHRIGDYGAQEGADYLKFKQLGTQQRMALMRGFEAYWMKKHEEGKKRFTQMTCSSSAGPRGSVAARRLTRSPQQRGEELGAGPQQVVRLDVENADRYQRWKQWGWTGPRTGADIM